MEDAYAFCTSFTVNSFGLGTPDLSRSESASHIDKDLLPDKLAIQLNPIKFFEIDFEALSSYFKRLTTIFPDEAALRTAFKQLI